MDPSIEDSDFSGSFWDTANSDFLHYPEPPPLYDRSNNTSGYSTVSAISSIDGSSSPSYSTFQTDDAVKHVVTKTHRAPPLLSPVIADESKFACPYRKHNPEKYRLENWRSCALSGFKSVARVKLHLYRYHRVHLCSRCKNCFPDEEQLDAHIEIGSCPSNHAVPTEGITRKKEELLRCKKNFPSETQVDRWGRIYQILFPGAIVPSPFFDPLLDENATSPGPNQLHAYEEYCARKLPIIFRQALEHQIKENGGPEEWIRSKLTSLVQECQDRVFSSYRNELLGSEPEENHGELRSHENKATVFAASSTGRRLEQNDCDSYSQDTNKSPGLGQLSHGFMAYDNTISDISTPSLTTGLSTIDTSSEENYLPSSAAIHNTEFQCLMEGCSFRGTPREWLESKHREEAHENSSRESLLVVDAVPVTPHSHSPTTDGRLNSEFRYLGNSHLLEASSTFGQSDYPHNDNQELLLAELNPITAKVSTPLGIQLPSQKYPGSSVLEKRQTTNDPIQDRDQKKDSEISDSEPPELKVGADMECFKGPLLAKSSSLAPHTASVDSHTIQILLNDSGSSTAECAAGGSLAEVQLEMLVQPVLLSLGESFIDCLVDELRYGQADQGPECSDTDLNNNDSPSSSSHGPQTGCSSTSASTTSAISSISSTTAKKRRLGAAGNNLAGGDDDDGIDGGDGADRKRQRGRNGQPRKGNNKPFACPFRKNDREKYSYNNAIYKTCVTTSWPDISHLKGHIEQVHKARCSSCKILIKDENEHQTHLEKSTSDGTECKEIDGLSKEAMASLKQLKPTAGDRQARWEILYTHLFPEGSSMPNPWFESEGKGSKTEDEADLRKKVENFLPHEIAAFIETRQDIVECFAARLRERFRNNRLSENPELIPELAPGVSSLNGTQQSQQTYPSEPIFPTNDTNNQDRHLDFGMLNFSNLADPPSEEINRAYQNGYAAGYEEGYQQGTKDGYQAGKKAEVRTQNLAYNHGAYGYGAAVDSMGIQTLARQPSGRDPWGQTNGLSGGEGGTGSELYPDQINNWQENEQTE